MDTVRGESSGGASNRRAALIGIAVGLHYRNEAQQVIPISKVQGSVRNDVVVDDGSERSVFGRETWRVRLHDHRFVAPADFEEEVVPCLLRSLEKNFRRKWIEAALVYRHHVAADRQLQKRIVAGCAAAPDLGEILRLFSARACCMVARSWALNG